VPATHLFFLFVPSPRTTLLFPSRFSFVLVKASSAQRDLSPDNFFPEFHGAMTKPETRAAVLPPPSPAAVATATAAYERDWAAMTRSAAHVLTPENRAANRQVFQLLVADGLIPLDDIHKLNDCDLIYRFLIARRFDVAVTHKSLVNYIAFRRRERINELLWEPFPAEVAPAVPKFLSCDRDGIPVSFNVPDPSLLTKLLKRYKREELMRYNYYSLEQGRRLCKALGMERFTSVMDLDQITMGIVTNPSAIGMLQDLSHAMQEFYPENVRSVYICNGGWAFSVAWAALRPLLDERLLAKFNNVGGGSKAKLAKGLGKAIDLAELPERYGGTKPESAPPHPVLAECIDHRVPVGTPPIVQGEAAAAAASPPATVASPVALRGPSTVSQAMTTPPSRQPTPYQGDTDAHHHAAAETSVARAGRTDRYGDAHSRTVGAAAGVVSPCDQTGDPVSDCESLMSAASGDLGSDGEDLGDGHTIARPAAVAIAHFSSSRQERQPPQRHHAHASQQRDGDESSGRVTALATPGEGSSRETCASSVVNSTAPGTARSGRTVTYYPAAATSIAATFAASLVDSPALAEDLDATSVDILVDGKRAVDNLSVHIIARRFASTGVAIEEGNYVVIAGRVYAVNSRSASLAQSSTSIASSGGGGSSLTPVADCLPESGHYLRQHFLVTDADGLVRLVVERGAVTSELRLARIEGPHRRYEEPRAMRYVGPSGKRKTEWIVKQRQGGTNEWDCVRKVGWGGPKEAVAALSVGPWRFPTTDPNPRRVVTFRSHSALVQEPLPVLVALAAIIEGQMAML
jgi:hypothetical protein